MQPMGAASMAPFGAGEAVSYVRAAAPLSTTLLALVNAFWPVLVIVSMGLGLLWGGMLANSP